MGMTVRERVDRAYSLLKSGHSPEAAAFELGYGSVEEMTDDMATYGDNTSTGRTTELMYGGQYYATIAEEDAPPPERLIACRGRSLVEYDANRDRVYAVPFGVRLNPREAFDLMDCLRRVLRGQKVIYEREKRRRREG